MNKKNIRKKETNMTHFQNSSFTIDEVEKFLGYSLKKVGAGSMGDKNNENILSIRGMSKSFGRNRVLDHINLDVKKGSIMGRA